MQRMIVSLDMGHLGKLPQHGDSGVNGEPKLLAKPGRPRFEEMCGLADVALRERME